MSERRRNPFAALTVLSLGLFMTLLARIAAVARDVFDHAFVSAMKWSLVLPALVLIAAGLACLGIQPPRHRDTEPAPDSESESEAVAA
jgi:hypothetical protein